MTPATVAVSVNGEPWSGVAGTTVAGMVGTRCPSTRGVAVARNGEVVPKSRWDEEVLVDGDRIEIVTAAAGG